MAFNDAKRYSDRLRLKNVGIYDQGDPHARREQCWSPWCDRFVEDMDDSNRCNTDECNNRLHSEALSRGHMFRVNNVIYGSLDALLVKPESVQASKHTQAILKRRGLDNTPIPMCACGINPKAPNKDICQKCYQAVRLAEHYRHKQSRVNRQRGATPGFNRISGLDGLDGLRKKLK